jgi:hypothetical protein
MSKPKSLLKSITIDKALRAHNCQHNKNHRILKDEVRLGIKEGRSTEYYCKVCAVEFLTTARDRSIALIEQLQTPQK